MRAVPAPHLFIHNDRLARFMKEAEEMKKMWDDLNSILMKQSGSTTEDKLRVAVVQPRAEQKVFVFIGSDDAVAGMESLIKSAEQFAADEDLARYAAEKAAIDLKEEEDRKAAAERAKVKKSEQ